MTAVLLALGAGYTAWQAGAFYLNEAGRHRLEAAWFVFAAVAIAAVWVRRRRTDRGPDAAPETAKWPAWLVMAAMIPVAMALYWPAISLGLLADDFVLLDRSLAGSVVPGGWQFYRPLPLLFMKLGHALAGPALLHTANIVLHGVNAWLLWRLADRLGHSRWPALAAATVFLFFPAAVEPVGWNSGIFDVAVTAFGLTFLHLAMTPGRTALALFAFSAALSLPNRLQTRASSARAPS